MGRWGSDIVALACIAGGAIVGSGVTAALLAGSAERYSHRVAVVCASESPRVVVQLSGGRNAASTSTIHVRSHSRCDEAVHVDLTEMETRMEEARERMDEARERIEVASFRVQEAREVREVAKLRVEGLESEIIEVEELRMEEVREALEKLRAEAERVRASGGND